MKLGDIADVRIGLVLGRKQAQCGDNVFAHNVLTLSSVGENCEINKSRIEKFEANEPIDNHYLTNVGDIIIRLSTPNVAVVITKENAKLLIPSQFAVIRNIYSALLPAYVAICLNGRSSQALMTKECNGTIIKTISTTLIKEIDIQGNSIERQKQIIRTYNLIKRKEKIISKLSELEKTKQTYIIETLLEGEKL